MNKLFKRSVIFTFLLVSVVLMAFSLSSGLTVTSPAFGANGMIPAKYTCEGAGISPPLQVSGIPAAAKSLAIIVHDPDAPRAGGVTHWVAFNLPVDGTIPEDFKGAVQGLNSNNQPGYKGMCPHTGTHHYHFMVFALDSKLAISENADKAGLEKAMQGHILAKGELIGLYTKSVK